MHILSISDILTFPVATVSLDCPIQKVLTTMRDKRISAIVVVENETPMGIFTERDAVMLAYHHQDVSLLTVSDVMGKPLVSVLPHIDFREGYRKLLEHNVRHLIVVNEYGKLEGIVSESDFIEHLDKTFMLQYKEVSALMTHNFLTLTLEASIEDAVTLMGKEHGSYVIIEKNYKAVGIFTERDLVRLESKEHYKSSPLLKEVMTYPVTTVPVGTPLPEALKIMQDKRIRRLIVVDKQNHILGLVAYHDIVKKLYSPHVEHLMQKLEDQNRELQLMEIKLNKEREFRRIQKHLLESQRLAHIGSWELDFSTKHLWWSEETFNIFEVDATKFDESYKHFLSLVHPKDRDFVNNTYTDSVANHTPYEISHRLCFDDGRIKYVNEHCETFYDEEDNPLRSVGTVQDITKQKESEKALKNSYNLLTTIIDTAPLRIFWKDQDLNYLGCNIAFAKDAGKTTIKEIIGKNDYALSWKDQAENYQVDDYEVMNSNRAKLSFDEVQTTPEGKKIWLRTSKVPLLNEKQETIGIIGMYEDVTLYKEKELHLRQSSAVFENTSEGIMITDNNKITHVTPKLKYAKI